MSALEPVGGREMPREYPAHAARFVPWLQRVQAVILLVGGLYLIAIDVMSPHHLPGLRWLSFLVMCAGLQSMFLSTRFRWIEIALLLAVVALGGLALVELTGLALPHRHH